MWLWAKLVRLSDLKKWRSLGRINFADKVKSGYIWLIYIKTALIKVWS